MIPSEIKQSVTKLLSNDIKQSIIRFLYHEEEMHTTLTSHEIEQILNWLEAQPTKEHEHDTE